MRLCSNSRRDSFLSPVQDTAGRRQTPNLPVLPAPNWTLSALNQAQYVLWMCKQVVVPQPWPKIVASLLALHPCCYRCSWTFGEHLHSLTGGCVGKTGCGLGQKIKSGGGERLVRYYRNKFSTSSECLPPPTLPIGVTIETSHHLQACFGALPQSAVAVRCFGAVFSEVQGLPLGTVVSEHAPDRQQTTCSLASSCAKQQEETSSQGAASTGNDMWHPWLVRWPSLWGQCGNVSLGT